MTKYYCYFYLYLLSCCFISTIAFAQPSDINQTKDFIQKSKDVFETNPSLSYSYAKKAESLLHQQDEILLEAEIYTILGDIDGLKQNRSDKAADYHRKTLDIYSQLIKSKKINCQVLYNFFLEHVTPIYELISSEKYHRHRRDKLAIRKYQTLYTELSRFFLENEVKKTGNVFAKLVQHTPKEYIQVNNPIEQAVEKHLEYKLLSYEQKKLYEEYIAKLENSLNQNRTNIGQIKKEFQEKNRLIQQKMEALNLILIRKDSLLLQDSLINTQKILLANNQHKMKEAYYQIKGVEYQKNMMFLALLGLCLACICIGFYWNYQVVKKQKKQIEDQNQDLKIINEELDQFSYRVSHDIRAPIASVMGLVNISRDENDMTQLKNYFSLMEKSLKKLDEFIKDILTHSQNARTEVEVNDIVLQDLIEEVIAQHRFSALNNKIDIRMNIEQNGQVFYSDAYRLKIILNNLIANSIRYFDRYKDSSYLEIDGRINEQNVSLQIRDNGVGIAEEHLQRVFDMFYRANSNTTGSGLGLYIVKQSVKKIGGEIKINSYLGEGTSFQLEVPNMLPPSSHR